MISRSQQLRPRFFFSCLVLLLIFVLSGCDLNNGTSSDPGPDPQTQDGPDNQDPSGDDGTPTNPGDDGTPTNPDQDPQTQDGTDNRSPNAVISAPEASTSGQTVTLDGSGSYDPDGDTLSYKWTQTGGQMIGLSDSSSSKLTFVAPAVSQTTEFTFQLAVNDGKLSNVTTVSIQISSIADDKSPMIVSRSPQPGKIGVSTTTEIRVVFNEALLPASVDAKSLLVSQSGSEVPGVVSYDSANNAVTIKPSSALSSNTTYTVTLAKTLEDLSGNTFAGDSWSFTTATDTDTDTNADTGTESGMPTQLKCEYLVNPLGIDSERPRFSWQLNDTDRGEYQSAYQIIVASTEANIDQNLGDLWDSDKVASSRQNGVKYAGSPLASRSGYWWKVRVWDKDEHESLYSEKGYFETGMMAQSDWSAQWIGGDYNLLRGDLELDATKAISKARLYVTSLGYNEVYINGRKAGIDVANPGYTKYQKRALYSTYDVTDLLNAQNNAVGIMLGNAYNKKWGLRNPALLLELHVTYTDGSSESFGTNTSTFKALNGGPITENGVWNGESYDARKEASIDGWSNYGFNDSGWATPKAIDYSGTIAAQLQAVRVTEDITPVSIRKIGSKYMVDMGTNMVGWVRIAVQGSAGTVVTMRFAEILKKDDESSLETATLLGAEATDTYTLKGTGTEVWEPRFTHHGFRYVEISGYPGTLSASDITGRVIHSNYSMESSFSSSNAMINTVYEMYRRSQRGNTVSIPTDCPQRDERQGWGADALLTADAAMISFDMLTFYEKWSNDIDDVQGSNGGIPVTVPDYFKSGQSDTAWMSIRVTIPWELYKATGDTYVLEKHYDKMKLYINYLQEAAGSDYLGTPAKYGDWVKAKETESAQYFADAYFYHDVNVMSEIAGALGKTDDQATFSTLASNIRNAFNKKYFHSTYYGGNTQSANAVALDFDIVPEDARSSVLNSLINDIESRDSHVTSGILGTKATIETLWKDNRSDIAYNLLTQTSYPSWIYMYDNGPGTLWETWNADGRIATGNGSTSLNHVMFGGGPAVWFYKGLAGISALKPGYEEIQIRPEIVGDLTSADGSVMTPRGMVSSNWEKVSSTQVNLNVTIPVNSKAIVYVPTSGATNARISESGEVIYNGGFSGGVNGVESLHSTSSDFIAFTVGSGSYSFVMTGGAAER